MSQPSPFTVKGICLPGEGPGSEWVVEVTCRPPTGAAFAVVLDLSDSSGAMRDEASKFARLVKHLPRTMPVWLYRLSAHVPVTYERHPIAHFQDGTIELSSLLEDARTREFMSRRGSLFRPVLESICERKTQEGLSEVRIIVLTDGELLDAAELRLPVGITIVGITRTSSDAKCKHWRRVLPTCPIYDLQDAALDSSFEDIHTAFFGACDISWHSAEGSRLTKAVSLLSGQVLPLEGEAITWNFADQPIVLMWSTVDGEPGPLRMTFRSKKNQQACDIVVGPEMAALDGSTVEAATALLNVDGANHSNVLLDAGVHDSGFESVRTQFLFGQHLAESRASWLSGEGDLQVWNELGALSGITKYDALLCLGCLLGGSTEVNRIVVVGLQKRAQPAFAIGKGPFLDIGESPVAITISFDNREARWMLHAGGDTRELDPRGSQRLEIPLESAKGLPVVAFFSGPLR